MRGDFLENRQVRFDGVLDAVLLQKPLGAVQMLVDVCHSCGLPLRSPGCSRNAGGALASLPKLYTAKKRRAKTPARAMRNHTRQAARLPGAVTAKRFQFFRRRSLAERLFRQLGSFAKVA